MKLTKKRPKIECEICGEKDVAVLDRHHIVERTEVNSNNDDFNLCVICSSCHRKVHNKSIKIIGVFPGTKPPTGRILVYIKDRVCNIPGMENAEPYYVPKLESIKLH